MFKKNKLPPLQLLSSAGDFMVHESRARAPRETGGILIGTLASDGLMITRAVGPGPNARHESSGFKRDGQYSQNELDRIFAESEGREDYVGEWHSHPARCEASAIDARSMGWVSGNGRYCCDSPALIVSVPAKDERWDLLGYQWSNSRLVRCPISIVEQPGVADADR